MVFLFPKLYKRRSVSDLLTTVNNRGPTHTEQLAQPVEGPRASYYTLFNCFFFHLPADFRVVLMPINRTLMFCCRMCIFNSNMSTAVTLSRIMTVILPLLGDEYTPSVILRLQSFQILSYFLVAVCRVPVPLLIALCTNYLYFDIVGCVLIVLKCYTWTKDFF